MKRDIAVPVKALASRVIACFVFLLICSNSAFAAYLPWVDKTHTVMEGDYNDDGIMDIYLKPNHSYIPIIGGVTIFIVNRAQPFLLLGNQSGEFELAVDVDDAMVRSTEWSESGYQKHLADFDGDGATDYFLQPGEQDQYGIILLGPDAGNPVAISQFIKFEDFGYAFSQDQVKLNFVDLDGDGFIDIILQAHNEQSTTQALISNNGVFEPRYPVGGSGMAQPPIVDDATSEVQIEDYALNDLVDSFLSQDVEYPLDISWAKIAPGSLAADFDITPSGTVSYRIPLDFPAGPAGMAPRLAVTYRSGGFEGQLGAGWTLEGLGSIRRCEKNKFDNGVVQKIGFPTKAGEAQYCIGDDQLVYIGSYIDSESGAVGNEFRTRDESFARVVAFGDEYAPTSWKVWSKDGLISHYGESEESLISISSGKVLLWLLSKSSDRHGNYTEYKYLTKDGSGFYIDKINYGKNDGLSSAPIYSVEFEYIDRDDKRTFYVPLAGHYGKKRTISTLLKKIRVITSDSLSATYELGYEKRANAASTLLSDITKCGFDADGGKYCFAPTHFDYSSDSNAPTLKIENKLISGRTPSTYMTRDFFFDVNGDSRLDLISVSASAGSKATAKVFFANISGTYAGSVSQQLTTTVQDKSKVYITVSRNEKSGELYLNELNLQNNAVRLASWAVKSTGITKLYDSSLATPDFSFGDGWVVGVESNSSTFNLYEFDDESIEENRITNVAVKAPDGTLVYPCEYVVEHFRKTTTISVDEGDVTISSGRDPYFGGRTVPSGTKTNGSGFYWHSGKKCRYFEDPQLDFGFNLALLYGPVPLSTRLTDYGPSLDAAFKKYYPKGVFKFDGYNETYYATGVYYSSSSKEYSASLDFNNDGLNDLAVLYKDGQQASINFHLNTANPKAESADDLPIFSSLNNIGPWVAGDSNRAYKILNVNFNNDQLADLVVMRYAGNDLYMDVYPSSYAGYSPEDKVTTLIKSGVPTDEKYEFYAQDLDGTGKPQIVGLSNKTSAIIYIKRDDWQPLMVRKITDGLGGSVDITYSPLVSNVHDFEPVVSDFENLYAPLSGLYVVSSVATSSSTSADRPTSYPYQSVDSEPVCYEASSYTVEAYTYDAFTIPGFCMDGYWLEPQEIETEVCVAGVCTTETYLTESTFVQAQCYGAQQIPGGTIPGFTVSSPAYCSAADPGTVIGNLNEPFVAGAELDSPADKQRVIYHYSGFLAHKNGLGALGFREVTKTDVATGIRTVATYSQDYVNRQHGWLLSSDTYVPVDGADVLTKQIANHWETITWSDGRYRVLLKATTEKSWELDGTLMSDTTKTMLYDLESDPESGVGNLESVSFEQRDGAAKIVTLTENWYEQDNFEAWLVGMPTRTKVTKTQSGTSYNGQSVHVVAKTYDENTGKLLSETTEPVEFSSSITPVWKRQEYTYYPAGVVETVTESGADIPTISTRFEYDAAYRWQTKKTYAYGTSLARSVTTKPHPVLGKPMLETDINGLRTRWTYDAFGRVTAQLNPDGTYSETSYVRYDSDYAAYYVETRTSDGAGNRVYYDRKNRKIHERKTGVDGRTVYQDTLYDTLGRVKRTSLPYLGGTPSYWNDVLRVDALGRPIQSVSANGAYSEVEYRGRTVATTNTKGQIKEITVDGFGRKIAYTEYKDGLPITLQKQYDVDGNLRASIDTTSFPSISVVHEYNLLGQNNRTSDPNSGTWTYDYDVAGKLIRQTDANGVSVCFAYDILGRKVKQVGRYRGDLIAAKQQCAGAESDHSTDISEWYYDSAQGASLGQVHQVLGSYSHANGQYQYREEYYYDAYSRVRRATKLIDGVPYDTESTYYDNSASSSAGKLKETTYPSGLNVEYRYNGVGVLSQMVNPQNQTIYWEMLAANAFGQVSAEKLGNGVKNITEVNPTNGRAARIYSTLGFSTDYLFDNVYEYDKLGNLESRQDGLSGAEERFSYDSLNRLDSTSLTYSINGHSVVATYDYEYTLNGNLKSHPEVSAAEYQYGVPQSGCTVTFAGPHAVTKAGNTSYCYDRNGSVVRRGSDSIQYNDFGKAVYIANGASNSRFWYGPNGDRYKRHDVFSGTNTTTVYVGGYEKVVTGSSNIKEKHYLGGVAVVTIENSVTTTNNYLHKDYLGSIVGVTDQYGAVVEQYSYDPWGRRRSGSWQTLDATALDQLVASVFGTATTTLGYTGHEMLDNLGLIHMNGRVYDPLIARMLSADPVTTDPDNLQSYNRYSYVINNPLRLVDPSGYSFEDDVGVYIEFNSNGAFNIGVGNSGDGDYEKLGIYNPQFNFEFDYGSLLSYESRYENTVVTSAGSSYFVDLTYDTYQSSEAFEDAAGSYDYFGTALNGGSDLGTYTGLGLNLAVIGYGRAYELNEARLVGYPDFKVRSMNFYGNQYLSSDYVRQVKAAQYYMAGIAKDAASIGNRLTQLGIAIDVVKLYTHEISNARFAFHVGAAGLSLSLSTVPGAVVGTTAFIGESLYDQFDKAMNNAAIWYGRFRSDLELVEFMRVNME